MPYAKGMEASNSEGLALGGGFMTHKCKFGMTSQCPLLRIEKGERGPQPYCMKGAPKYDALVTTSRPANCSGTPNFEQRTPGSLSTQMPAENAHIETNLGKKLKRAAKRAAKRADKATR